MKLRYPFAIGALAGLLISLYLHNADDGRDASGSANPAPAQTEQPAHAFIPAAKPAYVPPAPDAGAVVYEMGGKRFTVSGAVRDAFKAVESSHGIPYGAMVAVCGRESDCDPGNINASSGACGLFQFMTNRIETLYEMIYKYGPGNGYAQEAGLVERYVRSEDKDGKPILGYRPVDDAAREQALALCLDPLFNAVMWASYTGEKVDLYNEWLRDRTITTGEIVAMNNLGPRGLMAFARRAWDDKKTGQNTLAVNFFKANAALFGGDVSANETLIKNENGTHKTVRDAYNEIFEFGGWGKLQLVAR